MDRDGTLNAMVYDQNHGIMDSPRRPEQVQLMPGAGAFMRSLRQAGFFVCVVTNQPGLAKGTLTLQDLARVNQQVADLLAEEDARWDELRYCPHHPDTSITGNRAWLLACECRKPKPGMLLAAAAEHALDLRASWMVGDGLTDVQAGRAAGCRTILVTKLKLETIERFYELDGAEPDVIAGELPVALAAIVDLKKK